MQPLIPRLVFLTRYRGYCESTFEKRPSLQMKASSSLPLLTISPSCNIHDKLLIYKTNLFHCCRVLTVQTVFEFV